MSDNNDIQKLRTEAAIEHVERNVAEDERDAATLAASAEATRRQQAENQAVGATIMANQAANTAVSEHGAANQARFVAAQATSERDSLRSDLAVERESANNSNFGMVFMTGIVLAVLIGLGIWYFNNNQQPTTATAPATTVNVTDRPATVSQPAQAPVVVNPAPAPPVIVNQPAAQAPAAQAPAPASAPTHVEIHNEVTPPPSAGGTGGTNPNGTAPATGSQSAPATPGTSGGTDSGNSSGQ